MALGALFGVGTGMAILTGVDVPGVGSWLVAVAVAKLGFISAFALIAAGAILLRRASRSDQIPLTTISPSTARAEKRLASGTADTLPIRQRDAVKQERRDTP
jgi:amino acid transporter